jgi:hypothetical protein
MIELKKGDKMKNGFTFIELFVVVFIITILFFMGVSVFQKYKNNNTYLENPIPVQPKPTSSYKIVVVDGCEYIESVNRTYAANYSYTLCHKGNCTNEYHLKSLTK